MISAKNALRTGRDNPLDRWNGTDASAAARIAKRIVIPQGRQSFTASAADTFFAIGSCFARNVEERLQDAGATVSSLRLDLPDLGDSAARATGILNKYNPHAILQELRWASGAERFPEEALFQLEGDDVWHDPHLRQNSGNGTKEQVLARRKALNAYFAQAFDADVVIITLGLIEAWVDLQTELTLNVLPDPKFLARNKGRFAFRCLSVKDCVTALKNIIAVLRAHGRKDQRIVLTVSPVALGRTFTDEDVIIANMTSKATLRVAAHRLTQDLDGVDYFPSYEAVLHSDPALAWQEDRLHVSDFMVGRIIGEFLGRYGVLSPVVADAGGEEDETAAMLAALRRDVDRYKNRIIALERQINGN
ncbi:GSCFA domain-containing protein [Falsirhodobacter deserti]|uniref:GSCFA domain-containing protein n=1 Tax=Falsirhodobacter deserti TaxID=1365611 RepID=UPI000FE390C0|nr:GSCFA domain-containing protein [Falsirhodobacter deserti]